MNSTSEPRAIDGFFDFSKFNFLLKSKRGFHQVTTMFPSSILVISSLTCSAKVTVGRIQEQAYLVSITTFLYTRIHFGPLLTDLMPYFPHIKNKQTKETGVIATLVTH